MFQPDILLVNKILCSIGCNAEYVEENLLQSVKKAVEEVLATANFKSVYCKIDDLKTMPPFLLNNTYELIHDYLQNAALFVGTLGLSVDKLVKKTSAIDLSQAVVTNAAANIILEDCVQRQIAENQPNGVLFCPGYSGTEMKNNDDIINILSANKIVGVYTTQSGIMIPEKSMCGIVLDNYKFSCNKCYIQSKCEFLKQKTRCYK